MFCFIILHYMVEEETVSTVSNLKKLDGDKRIIIVDNCSPNGSGEELETKYVEDPDVFVYLNDSNAGFARGNNAGCKIAKEQYDPDFYAVINNDIEVRQHDFINKIEQIWNEENFDVLGPDVFSTSLNVHQSPKSLENMTVAKAEKLLNDYQKKINSKFIVPLRCYAKDIHFLNQIYHKGKANELKIDHQKKYYNVPLHGSCFIFSRHFMEQRGYAFFPGTFFYFESEILDYECQKEGLKEMYNPAIKVYHHQNVSTNATFSDSLKRTRFMNEQNYNSISAFLKQYDA